MDLKRAALGYYRGSIEAADRFLDEAIKRKKEVDISSIKPYIKKILSDVEKLRSKNPADVAEDALMYSTLLQNAALFDKDDK